jgi:hypothetical protein
MPRYRIELIDKPGKPGGSEITNREVCNLGSDGEAIQRAKEFYRSHEHSVIGYRVIDDTSAIIIDHWMRADA